MRAGSTFLFFCLTIFLSYRLPAISLNLGITPDNLNDPLVSLGATNSEDLAGYPHMMPKNDTIGSIV